MNNQKEEINKLFKGKDIVLHDSLSGQNKKITLQENRIVNLYLCGPTVYSDVHIGNLRPVVFFDLITKILEEKNISYRYVQNITDVDDKIIKQSRIEGKEEKLLTNYYTTEYRQILKQLNVTSPEFYLVTENIETIINLIRRLLISGNAYREGGNVLFNINKNSGAYGKLSKQSINKLSKEKGREINKQQKRSREDFILWKKTKAGVSWETEWSTGRPGWHSECAAIIEKSFGGKTIDIHGGGKDLLFPHHENERIQYIAANDRELSKIWLHFGFVLSQNAKMSKSQGNYTTAKEFIEKYNGNTLRMLLLESRYSEDIEVSEAIIKQAVSRVKKIENIMKRISLFFYLKNLQRKKATYYQKEEVLELLLDNLQTTKAITLLEKNLNFINKKIDNTEKQVELESVINSFLFGLKIMGFNFQVREYSPEIKVILQNWKELSTQGRYKEADILREALRKEEVI